MDDGFKHVVSVFEFIKTIINENENLNAPRVVDDYETFKKFVHQYPRYLQLARQMKKDPGQLLEFFASVGEIVMDKTKTAFLDEYHARLKTFLNVETLKDETIEQLENLIEFLKANNKKTS